MAILEILTVIIITSVGMDLDFDDWFLEDGKYLNDTITIDPEPEFNMYDYLVSLDSWCTYQFYGWKGIVGDWMRCNA